MVDYVTDMVKDFPGNLPKKKVMCPWTDKMFCIDENSKPLDEKCKEIIHTFIMKGMFVCKHARQDIQPGICFLATKVWEPTEQDWATLVRLMVYLHDTKSLMLHLIADEFGTVYWLIDASFAVHPDYKSHTGAIMSIGKGAVSSLSTKQKVNTCSSTEAELVGINNVLAKLLWTTRFLEAQDYCINMGIVFCDNTSSMKLEENGHASANKCTRHFNIQYFYVMDLLQ